MRIPRKTHAMLDYLFGVLLTASPWIFNFYQDPVAQQVALWLGIGTVCYSLVTDYELGVLRFVPFSAHRFLDLLVGILLAGSTWHFQIGGTAGVVLTIFGVVAIAVVFLTVRPTPRGTAAS